MNCFTETTQVKDTAPASEPWSPGSRGQPRRDPQLLGSQDSGRGWDPVGKLPHFWGLGRRGGGRARAQRAHLVTHVPLHSLCGLPAVPPGAATWQLRPYASWASALWPSSCAKSWGDTGDAGQGHTGRADPEPRPQTGWLLMSFGSPCTRPRRPGAAGSMAASVTLVTGQGRPPPPSVHVPQGCKQGKVWLT